MLWGRLYSYAWDHAYPALLVHAFPLQFSSSLLVSPLPRCHLGFSLASQYCRDCIWLQSFPNLTNTQRLIVETAISVEAVQIKVKAAQHRVFLWYPALARFTCTVHFYASYRLLGIKATDNLKRKERTITPNRLYPFPV
jgi:hypothetical protein